jgi:hypothetical protein
MYCAIEGLSAITARDLFRRTKESDAAERWLAVNDPTYVAPKKKTPVRSQVVRRLLPELGSAAAVARWLECSASSVLRVIRAEPAYRETVRWDCSEVYSPIVAATCACCGAAYCSRVLQKKSCSKECAEKIRRVGGKKL